MGKTYLSYAPAKRFVSRIHLEPPTMFGRSEDLLEVKHSIREMRESLMLGEITVLLFARGDSSTLARGFVLYVPQAVFLPSPIVTVSARTVSNYAVLTVCGVAAMLC